jgi:plastocyanin
VLLAVIGGVAGLGPVWLATARPAWAFMFTVEVHDRQFSPKLTEIDKGDKVRWRRNSNVNHSITSGSDNWDYDETLGVDGAEAELRFNKPGEFTYFCKFHKEMTGTVVVNDPDAPPTTTTSTAPPTTTTTAPATTTTRPTPTTTEPPTSTTTAPRPPAGVDPPAPPPPVPATSAAPPPPLATSSTTTVPTSSTTTTVPPTTATQAPTTTGQAAPPETAPPSTAEAPVSRDTGEDIPTAAGPISRDGQTDPATVVLVAALVAVGLFGTWTLIRVRPGRV